MVKKRKNRGRYKGKGKKGRSGYVSCSNCGARVPRDKAKKYTKYYYPVEKTLARELEKNGAIINKQKRIKYYCVSCAIHYGLVKIGGISEKIARTT